MLRRQRNQRPFVRSCPLTFEDVHLYVKMTHNKRLFMDQQNKNKLPAGDRPVTSVKILLVHLAWLVFGPIALFVVLYGIIISGTGWFTILDALFFLVVALTIIARWTDQKSGQGTTADGDPSTWNDFRRYAKRLPLLSLVAWMVANIIGNHVYK